MLHLNESNVSVEDFGKVNEFSRLNYYGTVVTLNCCTNFLHAWLELGLMICSEALAFWQMDGYAFVKVQLLVDVRLGNQKED